MNSLRSVKLLSNINDRLPHLIKHTFTIGFLMFISLTLSAQEDNKVKICERINEMGLQLKLNIYPPGGNEKLLHYYCKSDTLFIHKYTSTILSSLDGSGKDTVIEQSLTVIPFTRLVKVQKSSFASGSIILIADSNTEGFIRFVYKHELSESQSSSVFRVTDYFHRHGNKENFIDEKDVDELRSLIRKMITPID